MRMDKEDQDSSLIQHSLHSIPMALALAFLGAAAAAAAVVALLEFPRPLAAAGDCPLDLSWSNFTLAASACSDQNEKAKCCRYINALVAVSVARYARTTGSLGVPSDLNGICLSSVSETLQLHGIPLNATTFCGLGPKIHVSFLCEGRTTVLEMLQSPNFEDVSRNCKMPLSPESNCRRCLNSDIVYLHNLIGVQDNVTLNTCRDAAFVALVNQGDDLSVVEFASCFFSVKELIILPGNVSEPSFQPLVPTASPSPLSAQAPIQHLFAVSHNGHHHKFQLILLLGIGIVVTGLAILLLIILILLIRKKNRELKTTGDPMETSQNVFYRPQDQECQEGPPTIFRKFSYQEIKKATENFTNIIGRGRFGIIYKAQFDDGCIAAVKWMNKASDHGEDEFCQEMELLGRLHHCHLVALKGFCSKRHERFLIYEYMENGSLKDHLHSPERPPLAWDGRIRIAIDVANALEYLHFYCDPPLCHRDIKSSNVLLDGNFRAKVADSCLAQVSRSGPINFEPANTDVLGTSGYLDPEYVLTKELTEKSDVYSYGVLLLELVTGRQAMHDNVNLVDWSQEFLATDSKLPGLVEAEIRDSFDLEQLQVVAGVTQWCTQKEGRLRPSIKQVLQLLYKGLDPAHKSFEHVIEDEERGCGRGRSSNRKDWNDQVMISFGGDARCLQSSSSTSRSFCSRSILLESSLPQSPTGISSP